MRLTSVIIHVPGSRMIIAAASPRAALRLAFLTLARLHAAGVEARLGG